MNRRLVQEAEAMNFAEKWEAVWMKGNRGGTCAISVLVDYFPGKTRKFIWLERRTGNKPSAELLRHMILKTVRRWLPGQDEEQLDVIRNLTGGYRVQLRKNPWRSIRVDEHGGVSDFIISTDELPRLLFGFPDKEPRHADGEDVAVYAL